MSNQNPENRCDPFFDFLKQVDKDYPSEQRFVTEADDIAEGQHMLLHLVAVLMSGLIMTPVVHVCTLKKRSAEMG